MHALDACVQSFSAQCKPLKIKYHVLSEKSVSLAWNGTCRKLKKVYGSTNLILKYKDFVTHEVKPDDPSSNTHKAQTLRVQAMWVHANCLINISLFRLLVLSHLSGQKYCHSYWSVKLMPPLPSTSAEDLGILAFKAVMCDSRKVSI